jgi:hypothetical protein
MKLCASPASTTCMYQRLARDQAPDEPDDNAPGPSPPAPDDGGPDAFTKLYEFLTSHLDPNDLGEAETLLRLFLDKSGGTDLGTDEPPPFKGRPRPGGAMDAQIRRGKAQAQQFLFDRKFPGAARIRVVG